MKTPLSNQTSWDTNRTTPFQLQNSLFETTYINTCIITIPNTRLISNFLRLHAVSSCFLLNLWHSNSPEPKFHFFLLESMSHLSPISGPWWSKGVYRCRFRCLQMSMSNVDRVPCKCRWKCRKHITKKYKKCPKMSTNDKKFQFQAPEDDAHDKNVKKWQKGPQGFLVIHPSP